MHYIVGYLPVEQTKTGGPANKILSPIVCHNGEEIYLPGVERLCEANDYDQSILSGNCGTLSKMSLILRQDTSP
jgi:hypothetical protein